MLMSLKISRIRVLAILLCLALVYFFFTCDDPEIIQNGPPLKSDVSELRASYDFVIIGGGQSGLTVANRLSEDGRHTVLVVEYGYLYHDDPYIARPFQPFNEAAGEYHDPKLMYNYTSTPQHALNGRRTPVPAGATVGGGSTVNGMFLNRGSAWDYDAWERLGNPGWGWKGLLPYFRKSVTYTPPGLWLQKQYGATYDINAAYGGNGPIHASNPAWAWPGQRLQIEGWKEVGLKQSREGAGGSANGIFWVPRAQNPQNQTRSYAVSGHLDAALNRSNFELLSGHRVVRVLLSESNRAYGIETLHRDGGNSTIIQATKEVILCAGLHSPLILQRSGIGPRNVLNEANIPVFVDLPGVGMNLQDHPTSGLGYEFTTDLDISPEKLKKDGEYALAAQRQFNETRSGPYAGGHNTVAFLPGVNFLIDPMRFVENIASQPVEEYLPAAYNSDKSLLAGFEAQRELIMEAFTLRNASLMEIPIAADPYILMILQKPLSRGTVTIDPLDPLHGQPLVDFATMANPIDLDVMVEMIRFARRWASSGAMKALSPVENWPGSSIQSDDEIKNHIKGMAESSIGHESGTCAMLPRELGGVVDSELLVYGVKALSVADASMMPLVPSTNLCATVYAVAEKAADLIKRRHSMKMSS